MIRLTCGNCGEDLAVDDAFAGGVFRCTNCGAIQTVPAADDSTVASTKKPTAKPLYRREEQADPASGLDQLADAVAISSGLGSGLQRTGARASRKRKATKSQPSIGVQVPQPPVVASKNDGKLRIAIATAALLGIAVVVLAISLLGDNDDPQPTEVTEPTFGGIELPQSVSFVLDAGTATTSIFEATTEAILAAMADDEANRFQIVLWPREQIEGESSVRALPARTLRPASKSAIDAVKERLIEAETGGSTTALPALETAFAAAPEAILLMTGNAAFLPIGFAEEVLDAWRASGNEVIVHTVALGASDVPAELAEIADLTGGEAIVLSRSDLRRLAEQFSGQVSD